MNIVNSDLILYECIVGSKAYGLSTPESDTDIKGVFIAPKNMFYSFSFDEQINNESNDITYYEISKFLNLLCKSNPTVLEMLFSPEDCILKRSSFFFAIKPEKFLSKKCEDSFARYAFTQIKKARGLNKKISNPLEKERKSILDFCFIFYGQGSIPIQKYISMHNFKEDRCGLVAIPHMENVYALFYDESPKKTLMFNGLVRDDSSMALSLSSVPKESAPIGHIYYNKNGFSKYCKEYKEYWDWVSKRNEARYAATVKHGKNYDSKNMMHTFRLLEIAEEIAVHKRIFVRRQDKEELLKIRAGVYSYTELIEKADSKLLRIEKLYKKTDLPSEPDYEYAEKLLLSIRDQFYSLKIKAAPRKERAPQKHAANNRSPKCRISG
jgi:uncharacterized protein